LGRGRTGNQGEINEGIVEWDRRQLEQGEAALFVLHSLNIVIATPTTEGSILFWLR